MPEYSSGEISFTFTAIDNATPTLQSVANATRSVADSTENASKKVDSMNISFMTQMIAVMGVYAGIRRIGFSLHELGIMNDATMIKFQKLTAVLGLVVGTFQLLRGAQKVITALTASERGLAIVETYRAVLNSPAKAALVGLGIGLAAGVGGYLLMNALGNGGGGGTEVTQNVTFGSYNMPDQRETARGTLQIMGG